MLEDEPRRGSGAIATGAGGIAMTGKRQTPQQQARETSRAAQRTNQHPEQQQSHSTREFQHGTQRNETQIEGGQRRDDAGSLDPASRTRFGKRRPEKADSRRTDRRNER
jgi:hypothetical protein